MNKKQLHPQKMKDLKDGEETEERIHPELEKYFGKLYNTRDNDKFTKFYEFDKYNDEYYIEIKGHHRNYSDKTIKTMFFGENKYNKGCELLKYKPDLKIIYCWACLDGIYYWPHNYSNALFDKRGRKNRGKDEMDDCVIIYKSYIRPISEHPLFSQ